MSLDALIAELTRTADAESKAILSAAEARAGAIRKAGEDAALRRRESGLARLADANHRALARETVAAERENRLVVLEARARLLDEILTRAAELLAATESACYRAGVGTLVESTLRYLEGTPSILRCRSDLAECVVQHSALPDVRVEVSDQAAAGVLGTSSDGTLVVDNTLPTHLARRRATLSIALAVRLEEE